MTSHSATTIGTSDLSDVPTFLEDPVVGDLRHSVCLEEEGHCEERPRNRVMIDILPDDVLLEIFDFYKDVVLLETFDFYKNDNRDSMRWSWITLIHVCQRWRHIIFGSPQRLDLRLHCSDRTPARRLLDIWPPVPISISSIINPISIWSIINEMPGNEEGLANIMTALERRDRVSSIFIYDRRHGYTLKKIINALLEPFPALTTCRLISGYTFMSMHALSETFLGGSAPLLRSFTIRGISFPTFPNFILSSTQIQHLSLADIPDSGYISPKVMATCLAALPNLRHLFVGFQSARPHPVEVTSIQPPLTRAVLSALTSFTFEGVSEYFEDLIARIDTPQLVLFGVTFFMQLNFDIPRLHDFMNRTERFNQATMKFDPDALKIIFESQAQFKFIFGIKCKDLNQQLSSTTQIFSQHLPLLSHVEHFEIRDPCDSTWWWMLELGMVFEFSDWLELFRLLVAVQSLYVSEIMASSVAVALKEVTEEIALDVLPALRSLSFEGLQASGSVQDVIKSFVRTRRLTNHPVVIQSWEPQSPPQDFSSFFL